MVVNARRHMWLVALALCFPLIACGTGGGPERRVTEGPNGTTGSGGGYRLEVIRQGVQTNVTSVSDNGVAVGYALNSENYGGGASPATLFEFRSDKLSPLEWPDGKAVNYIGAADAEISPNGRWLLLIFEREKGRVQAYVRGLGQSRYIRLRGWAQSPFISPPPSIWGFVSDTGVVAGCTRRGRAGPGAALWVQQKHGYARHVLPTPPHKESCLTWTGRGGASAGSVGYHVAVWANRHEQPSVRPAPHDGIGMSDAAGDTTSQREQRVYLGGAEVGRRVGAGEWVARIDHQSGAVSAWIARGPRLTTPPGTESLDGIAVNAEGSALGDIAGYRVRTEVTLWSHGQRRDLTKAVLGRSHWRLTQAVAINSRGEIAALGTKQQGNQVFFDRSFLLIPVADGGS